MKKNQIVFIDWKDDTSSGGTSEDGSYTGLAKFFRCVSKENLKHIGLNSPHYEVCINDEYGPCIFPVDSVKIHTSH